MKLHKMGLFGMLGMVLTFGVVIPQNVNAADAAGIQRLGYYDKLALQGKALSKEDVDEIEKIIRKDGKVDADEYRFISNLLDDNDYFDNKILPSDRLKTIQTLHNDYINYDIDVEAKYPELVNLGSKLPSDLREQIDDLVLTNIIITEHLSGDEKLDDGFKKIANSELAYIKNQLAELKKTLDVSPYKKELTKIYDAEKLLYEENLKRLSEK